MKRYHFTVHTGPTAVGHYAEALRAAAMSWQAVTCEGTERVHFSIDALFSEAAWREVDQWLRRAGMASFQSAPSSVRFTRADAV